MTLTRMTMDNNTIKQQIFSDIHEFRQLDPAQDNATILNQFRQIKQQVGELSGSTADERELYLQAVNVVQLFSSQDERYFLSAASANTTQKTAALRRLQEWAKRAGDILQDI